MCDNTYNTIDCKCRFSWLPWIPLAVALVMSPLSIEIVVAQDLDAETVTPSANTSQNVDRLLIEKPSDGSPPTPVDQTSAPVSDTSDESTVEAESGSSPATKETDVSAEIGDASFSTTETLTIPPKTRVLSVKPGVKPLLPEDHPRWITESPDYKTEIHRMAVGSIPTPSVEDVDHSLDEPLLARMYDYIDQQVLRDANGSTRVQDKVTVKYIWNNLIDDKSGYVAELNTSEGPMYQKWVSVNVSEKQRQQLSQWNSEAIQRERLKPLGLGLLSLFGLVAVTHLALRRRHGSPAAVVQQPQAIVESQIPAPRKSGMKVIGILACIFAIPLILVVLGALTLTVSRQKEVLHLERALQQEAAAMKAHATAVEEALGRSRAAPSTPEAPVPLHDETSQKIITSGNQTVIISSRSK